MLHNYLASTYTLIEHGKKVPKSHHRISRDYEEKIITLEADDCYGFCRSLRHITQHQELLELITYFSRVGIPSGEPAKHSIILRQETLKDYHIIRKTDRESFRRYISNHDQLDLKIALNQYENILEKFYAWFNCKIEELYENELREYSTINTEIKKIQEELAKK